MNVGNALKITCVGLAAGVMLRTVQMLFFYDYETGFYTDNGTVAWISLTVPLLLAGLAVVMCLRSGSHFGPFVPRKNIPMGLVTALSGVILIFAGFIILVDFLGNTLLLPEGSMPEAYPALYTVVYIPFAAFSVLFGMVQIMFAVSFFGGSNSIGKAPLLYITAVLWSLFLLILMYIFYARTPSFTDNFFAIFSSSSILLTLFYLTKLISSVDESPSSKRMFLCGIFAVVISMTSSLSNLVLMFLSKTASNKIDFMIQLSVAGVAAFLLVFLVTFRKYSLRSAALRRAARDGISQTGSVTVVKPSDGE